MEKSIVIDTSIVVKWFVQEEGTEASLKLLTSHKKGLLTLHAPAIVPLELANALYYGGGFKTRDLEKALSAFYSFNISLTFAD